MSDHQVHRPEYKRVERTGWRDAALSARHGTWGFNCPALDIDFLFLEYSRGKPVALVEYKHHHALGSSGRVETFLLKHQSFRAIRYLARASQIPFLVAYYCPGIWAFKVLPANTKAIEFFPMTKRNGWISEREYVATLYAMRGYRLEDEPDTLAKLNTKTPVRALQENS